MKRQIVINQNKNVVTSKFILNNINIAIFFISISLFLFLLNISYDIKLFIFSWIGNLILVWGINLFRKIKNTLINPYTFFYLSYFFFSFGQVFLYSFGVEYERFNLIRISSNDEILYYCLYFLIGTPFFLLGALKAVKKDITEKRNTIHSNSINKDLAYSLKVIGWLMFVTSAPIYLRNLFSNILMSMLYGYGSIYETATISEGALFSNVFESLGMWFIPSLFMLLVVYKNTYIIKRLILFLLILISIGIFIVGTRSESMAIILTLIYLWDAEVKKMKKRNKFVLAILVLLVILSLPVIQSFRGLDNKTIDNFLITFSTMQDNNNLIVDILGELGGSMHPWLLVNRLMPETYSFRLGQSYIASFLAIIPSFLLGGVSFTKYARLSGWLQSAANMSYGPGFSILAEAYYNFGWFGLPILYFIGWLYFKFLSNNMLKGEILKYKNLFSAIALFSFITSVRSSLYLTIRIELYSIIVPIIMIQLIYYRKKQQ